MLNQKELERKAVERYLDSSNQLFDITDFESPDFILKNESYEIGCEVTEFYPDYDATGSKLKKRESFIKKLHKTLGIELLDRYPKGFVFDICYEFAATEKTSIKSEVQSVINNIESYFYKGQVIPSSINIRKISIRKTDLLPTRLILSIPSHYSDPTQEWLQPIIDSKSSKIKEWKRSFDKRWLIISIGISISGDLNLNKIKNLEILEPREWNKIILIDIPFGDYKEFNSPY
jgi:hypothetical protein